MDLNLYMYQTYRTKFRNNIHKKLCRQNKIVVLMFGMTYAKFFFEKAIVNIK